MSESETQESDELTAGICQRCLGIGEIEKVDPYGDRDVIDCPDCGGER